MLLASSGSFNRLVAQVEGEDAQPVPAANADAAGEPETGESTTSDTKTLGNEIFKWPTTTAEWVGVLFYLVLFVFSLVAATVTVERLFNLRLRNVVPSDFATRLREMTRRGQDSRENLQALAAGSDTPIGRVLKAAVFRAGRPWTEVEKGMDDEMAWEMAALRGRHRALSVVGSVAPLVGLLGTVIGMIFAFMVTSQDTAAGRQAAELGKGIYLALLTTAAGLTIAIPCLLFAARFNAKVESYMRVMNETLLCAMNSFVRLEQRTDAGNTASANSEAAADELPFPVSAK
jgi:biopolymer transport protein ExbB